MRSPGGECNHHLPSCWNQSRGKRMEGLSISCKHRIKIPCEWGHNFFLFLYFLPPLGRTQCSPRGVCEKSPTLVGAAETVVPFFFPFQISAEDLQDGGSLDLSVQTNGGGGGGGGDALVSNSTFLLKKGRAKLEPSSSYIETPLCVKKRPFCQRFCCPDLISQYGLATDCCWE